MLNQLSRTLSRTLELEKVLDVIADIALEVAKAERTFILLWEDEQLVFGAGRDHDGPLPPQAAREISRTICQKVVDTQSSRPVGAVSLVAAVHDVPLKRAVQPFQLSSCPTATQKVVEVQVTDAATSSRPVVLLIRVTALQTPLR